MSDSHNPYTPPSRESDQAPAPGTFTLPADLRRQIAGVAKLMLAAGALQVIPAMWGLVRGGVSAQTLAVAAIAGFVPLFVMIAGMTLLSIGTGEVNDLAALLRGFRQLQVVFVVKGVMLIAMIALGIVAVAAMIFGFGRSPF